MFYEGESEECLSYVDPSQAAGAPVLAQAALRKVPPTWWKRLGLMCNGPSTENSTEAVIVNTNLSVLSLGREALLSEDVQDHAIRVGVVHC